MFVGLGHKENNMHVHDLTFQTTFSYDSMPILAIFLMGFIGVGVNKSCNNVFTEWVLI